ILQAQKSKLFDVVAVSSDSEEILQIARQYGVDYAIKRPEQLATDDAGKLPAIQHCVAEVERLTQKKFDTIVDIDATSPLRTIEDLRSAVLYFEQHDHAINLITAAPSRRSPYFNLVEQKADGFVELSKPIKNQVVRRQDVPKA